MDARLENQVALVTGGSRGIGRAIAERFAAEGADIALSYRQNGEMAAEVVESIRAAGRRAIAIEADASDEKAVRTMVDAAVSELGRLDILVNNAGVYRAGDAADLSVEVLDEITSTNVNSIIYTTQAAVPHMRPAGRGRVINLSSVSGIGTATSGTGLYAIGKATVIMLTKRFAFDLGTHGITVNAIAPGIIETDMSAACLRSQGDQDESTHRLLANTILGRTGQPGDVAGVAAFLASDDAAFMTGQVLVVDGGRTNFLSHSV